MEKKKVIVQPAQQLAEARAENLKQVELISLRPHGKMWGMDVFSWYNPLSDDLLTLFQSFPAPITWIGNKSMIENVFAEDANLLVNLTVVCAHNQIDFQLANSTNSAYLEAIIGSNDIKNGFEMIKARKQRNGILLFTASGLDWTNQREEFENYLKIEQA
jgi:hypothetical protein